MAGTSGMVGELVLDHKASDQLNYSTNMDL